MSAAVAAALFAPAASHAAGLGQANVASGLGQPLRVEIEVVNASADELASMTARLAPFSDSRNSVAPAVPLPADLRVAIEQRGRRAFVVVTTRSPVNEPFVVLPVELAVGGAGLVREFTLLLDPVEMRRPAPTQLAPVEPPVVARAPEPQRDVARAEAEPRVVEPRVPAARPAAPPVAVAPRPAATPGARTHLVQPGDSLGKIAAQVRTPDATTAQFAASIYRSNPNAFVNGDVNKLIAGRELAIPDAQTARAIDPNEAARMVGLRGDMPRAAATDTQQPAPRVQAAPRTGDTLTLSPERARQVDRLGVAEDRVAELEKSIEQLEALVARQAIMIQKMAEEQRLARGGAPANADANTPGAAAVGAQPNATAPAATTATPAPAQPAPAQPPAVSVPGKVAVQSVDSNDLMPLYGGLGVLLAGLFALYGVRRWRANRADAAMLPEAPTPTMNAPIEAAAPVASAAGLDLDLSQQQAAANAPSQEQLNSLGVSSVLGLDSLHSGLVDTEINPIAEAEVYLAYGRSAQAEEVLREALDRNPANEEVALRLLEIFADRRDMPAVDSVMQSLAASTGETGANWDRAVAIRRSVEADPKTMPAPSTPSASPTNFDPFSEAPKAKKEEPAPTPANSEFTLEDVVRPITSAKRDFG